MIKRSGIIVMFARVVLSFCAVIGFCSAFAHEQSEKTVWVAGAVNLPGKVPLIPEMTAIQAVRLANGLSSEADAANILIRRREPDRMRRTERLLYTELVTNSGSSFKLAAGDIIYVRSIRATPTFAALGQLKSPVIDIADGIKNWDSVMKDKWLKDSDKKNLILVKNFFNKPAECRIENPQDFGKLKDQIVGQGDLLVVTASSGKNFWSLVSNILSKLDIVDNLIKLFGSVITKEQRDMVGKSTQSDSFSRIAVLGEVTEPGTFPAVDSLTFGQYVALAGGPTQFASTNVQIISADGTERSMRGIDGVRSGMNQRIRSGDTIILQPVENFNILGVVGDVKAPFVMDSSAKTLTIKSALESAGPKPKSSETGVFRLSGLLGNPYKSGFSLIDESDFGNPLNPGDLLIVVKIPKVQILSMLNKLIEVIRTFGDALKEWGVMKAQKAVQDRTSRLYNDNDEKRWPDFAMTNRANQNGFRLFLNKE